MARKTETVIITGAADNRDNGKHFLLKEMPATQAEAWANRALLAIGRSAGNADLATIPGGMAGLFSVGLQAVSKLDWQEAEPLLAEMFACIKIIGDPNRPEATTRALVDRGSDEDDIEEVSTRWHLRERVISLHLGFSVADRLSNFRQLLSATNQTSPTMQTSPSPSAVFSPPASPPSMS